MAEKPVKNSVECWIVRRVVDAEDAVLLLHVAASPEVPTGFWQPVTGGIEEGETSREACVREIYEETSLKVGAEDVHEVAGQWEVELPHEVIRKDLYWVETSEQTIQIAPREHDDWKWVPISGVEAELYWESNRRTWAAVRGCLRP